MVVVVLSECIFVVLFDLLDLFLDLIDVCVFLIVFD